jgi:hypothetical protein
MQAIPPVLLFNIPVFSVILWYIHLSTQYASRSENSESRIKSSRPLVSHLAFFSFGVLSVIAGSLGLAACTLGAHHSSLEASESVVVALIKCECKVNCFFTAFASDA